MMDKLFKLKRTVQTFVQRVLAGLTTFFAIGCIILFVNPQMLFHKTGMPARGVFLATIIGAVAVPLMMALLRQLTLCSSTRYGTECLLLPLQSYLDLVIHGRSLAMVFICGIISVIIALTNVRKMIIESIPNGLHSAISAGIRVSTLPTLNSNAGPFEIYD